MAETLVNVIDLSLHSWRDAWQRSNLILQSLNEFSRCPQRGLFTI
jgi:hypothetical protein